RSETATRETWTRPRRRTAEPAPRTGRDWPAPRGRSAPWRPPRRDDPGARSRRGCTTWRGTCGTGRRTGPGRAARPARAPGPGPGGSPEALRSPQALRPLPTSETPDGSPRYTLRPRQAQVTDLAAQYGPLTARRGGILHEQRPADRVCAQRADHLLGPVGPFEPDDPTGRQLARAPVGDIEAAPAERAHAGFQPAEERVEQHGPIDGAAAGGLAERRHAGGDLRRKLGRGPVGVDSEPDDHG